MSNTTTKTCLDLQDWGEVYGMIVIDATRNGEIYCSCLSSLQYEELTPLIQPEQGCGARARVVGFIYVSVSHRIIDR